MKTPTLPQLWTVSQRRVVIVLLTLFIAGGTVQLWRHPVGLSDPPPGKSRRGDEIADRINPNTADASALAAIPNLGEVRARQIVDYRTAFAIQHPGQTAFTRPEDLMRIKGIGAATVANLSPFLMFPPDYTIK